MSEHTPTPWAIRKGALPGVIVATNGDQIGAAFSDVPGGSKERNANALLIVEAVNNHEALKQTVAQLEQRGADQDREIFRLRSELEQPRGAVDVLERNASVQAKLLADTGRELEQAKWLVEEAAGHLRYLADKLGMIHGCDCEDCAQISSAKSFLAALPSPEEKRT